MSGEETPVGHEALQFDRVVTESGAAHAPGTPAVVCAACHTAVKTAYFNINGLSVCDRCRQAVEAAAGTPRGIGPLVVAGLFGLGAAVAGAAIYYAVIAIAHLEIGIIAILIGYMVGYAVRKGARGRGGLRFQILAIVLTYASVGLAYTPLAIKQAVDDRPPQAQAPAPGDGGDVAATAGGSRRTPTTDFDGGGFIVSFGLLILIATLPVLVVMGSFPSGLITAFIIFIGMRQAWRMTRAPRLEVLGPYRVGADPTSA